MSAIACLSLFPGLTAAFPGLDSLGEAYLSGSWHGFVAGVIVCLGLVYFVCRWHPHVWTLVRGQGANRRRVPP